ncbi:MAG TPA: mechanosensitive ion channel domain-containing protein, partial [Anaeromyxobacteraceae bacterium]|nr:mechanosensitive ion channel domain-containing protein [Anaeromyxobacteraceae bacterium]
AAPKEEAKPAEKPAPPPIQPIPPSQVFRAADELREPLGKAEAAAQPDPAVEEVERRLSAPRPAASRLRSSLEPARLQEASAREIVALRQALGREDLALADAQQVLEKRTTLQEGVLEDLHQRQAIWALTAEGARKERAPEAVVRRIAQAEQDLKRAETGLRARQDRLLELQGRVSDLRAEIARSAAAVDQAETALDKQLFEVESAPLWRALWTPDRRGGLAQQLRQALREAVGDIGEFLADPGRLWLHLALVVLLGLALAAIRRPVAALAVEDESLRGAVKVLSRPASAALLLSTLWVDFPSLPPTVRDLFLVAFLVPMLRLLRPLVPDAYRAPLNGLAALFALDRLAGMAPPRTLLARLAVLAVTGAALLGLLRGLRRGGWARLAPGGIWGLATRGAAAAAVALLSASLLSNVVGNATLAQLLTRATLTSATLAVALLGAQTVMASVGAALLRIPAVRRRPLVARHRDLLQRRAAWLLRVGSIALWALGTARVFGVDGSVAAGAAAVLDLRLKVGGLDVSLGDLAAFAVTLAASLGLARLVRFVLDEGVFLEMPLPRGISTAVSRTLQYLLVALGFSWALLASGMEMSRFGFLVGALGVGIGFGLQNVVNNFVSGVILLYERPIQVGDVIGVGSVVGQVTRIGVRSSTLRTGPGAEVIVPNGTLISAEVTNWTLSDRLRRIELPVGVAYGTPPERVIELLLGVVRDRPGVLAFPAPEALFQRLGDSALEFVLRFWTGDFGRWEALASEAL